MIENKIPHIFDNPILEKLTKTNSYLVISVLFLVGLLLLIYGFTSLDVHLALKISIFILGVILFTLTEYSFHRFLYHSGDNYKDVKHWQYKIHGVHHIHPNEKHYLAMPLLLALFVSSLFFFLFYFIIGDFAYFLFPGFIIGFSIYLFIHYKIHTSKPPDNIFKSLWKHHHFHHHIYDDKAFGVSSQLWDVIFRTMPPEIKKVGRKSRKPKDNTN